VWRTSFAEEEAVLDQNRYDAIEENEASWKKTTSVSLSKTMTGKCAALNMTGSCPGRERDLTIMRQSVSAMALRTKDGYNDIELADIQGWHSAAKKQPGCSGRCES